MITDVEAKTYDRLHDLREIVRLREKENLTQHEVASALESVEKVRDWLWILLAELNETESKLELEGSWHLN